MLDRRVANVAKHGLKFRIEHPVKWWPGEQQTDLETQPTISCSILLVTLWSRCSYFSLLLLILSRFSLPRFPNLVWFDDNCEKISICRRRRHRHLLLHSSSRINGQIRALSGWCCTELPRTVSTVSNSVFVRFPVYLSYFTIVLEPRKCLTSAGSQRRESPITFICKYRNARVDELSLSV